MTDVCKTPTTETNDQPAEPKPVTAEDILSLRSQPPTEPCEIPGRGTVFVHGLSNLEAHQWRADCRQDENGRIVDEYADAKLIVRCVRDAQGRRLFESKHVTQIVELPELVIGALVGTCTKLSAMGGAADATILKNYGATVAGNS